jgi:hypothetical protein
MANGCNSILSRKRGLLMIDYSETCPINNMSLIHHNVPVDPMIPSLPQI